MRSSSTKGRFLDSAFPFLLSAFLFLFPLFIHPQAVLAAIGIGSTASVRALDFFYEPRAQFLLAFTIFFLILWSLCSFLRGHWGHRDRGLDLPLTFFLISLLMSTLLNLEPKAFFGEARRAEGFFSLFSYAALFFFSQDFLKEERWRRIALISLILAGTIVAAYGVLQAAGLEILPRDSIRFNWDRSFSTIGNPVFLGSFLLLLLPLPLYFFPQAGAVGKIFSAAASLFFFAALILTGSRGAWLGLLFLLGLFFSLQKNRFLRRTFFATAIVLFIFLALYVNFSGMSFSERIEQAFSDSAGNTLLQRFYIWRTALVPFFERPLFGWGPDSFGDAFPQNAGEESLKTFGSFVYVDKAHNDLLQVGVTLGFVGLMAYLFLLGRFFLLALRERQHDDFLVFSLPALVGYWISLELSFSVVSVAPIFWVIMGMSSGRFRIAKA